MRRYYAVVNMVDHEEAIRDEIGRAAERLGGDGLMVRALPQAQIYEALDDLGADGFLLAYVNSWGDSMSDADELEGLRRWNRGEPPLDRVIASNDAKKK